MQLKQRCKEMSLEAENYSKELNLERYDDPGNCP